MALSFMGLLALVLMSGLIALEIGERGWIPELLVILAMGVLAGPAGFDVLRVTAAIPWVRDALILGAVLLLYEGTQEIPTRSLSRLAVGVGLLATLGVAVTAVIVAAAVHFLAGLTWPAGLLCGAAVAATDPAATAVLLRTGGLSARVRAALLGEAAFNDAVSLAFVSAGLARLAADHASGGFVHGLLLSFLAQSLLGIFVGLLVALAVRGVSAMGMRTAQLYSPLLVLFAVTLAYALAVVVGGSGFIAVFILGLVVGRGLAAARGSYVATRRFGEVANALVRVVVFFLLGAGLDPKALLALPHLALIAVPLVLALVARPLTVAVSLLIDRRSHWTWGEGLVLAASRPTGVVPAILAAFLAASGLRGGAEAGAFIADCVLVTLVLTPLLVPPLARRFLAVSGDEKADLT